MHRLTARALTEKRDMIAQRVHMIRYEFAQVGEAGAVVPPPTIEDIAMRTVESNAAVRTFDIALAVLDDIFRKLAAPDKPAGPPAPKESPYQ